MDNGDGLGKRYGYGHVTIETEHEMDAYCRPRVANIDATYDPGTRDASE